MQRFALNSPGGNGGPLKHRDPEQQPTPSSAELARRERGGRRRSHESRARNAARQEAREASVV